LQEIGRGSFAVVYKADFQVCHLLLCNLSLSLCLSLSRHSLRYAMTCSQGKPVAVKKFTEPEMLYEFRREVIIMGYPLLPNLCRVYLS
jgi:hypothetical protein